MADDKQQMTNRDWLKVLGVVAAITLVCNVARVLNPPKKPETFTITTCPEAKDYLEQALNLRNAVTNEEAKTRSGKAEWTKWHDNAKKAEQIQNELCEFNQRSQLRVETEEECIARLTNETIDKHEQQDKTTLTRKDAEDFVHDLARSCRLGIFK